MHMWICLQPCPINKTPMYIINQNQGQVHDDLADGRFSRLKRRTPSLSELTPIMFHMELTHLGLEVSIYCYRDNSNYDTCLRYVRVFDKCLNSCVFVG